MLPHAYRTEGHNVADAQVLQHPGGETGLNTRDVRTVLNGDDYADEVHADRRRTAEHGVTGVPSLVIDGRPPVSGVLPVADLQALLRYDPTGSHGVPIKPDRPG
ncbi:DsbA family protein [Nonomuraea sp. NPDC051941]|uniref:DsbA family protein n=1 Tax=Nonomuraea sp. NPDC051941 TaxID=3364373 RepID=UPI0037CB3717